ncbi:penicillin-binding protein 2A [Pontibacillus halophilus JSM 076056 = DSM 19796]|uniref:serine-type D-Ala-D-Ala carboxypeptidase n=1 Tax=Pontibacillus halophilus JSM 076056 = DSM 19796 TaxID=1385510 RepID=A0A0A5GJ60_9BACI|nr:penicillin-binding protein 2 [Pontibacillus halophilus]KGX92004.1 penicillin-binding protein 2A [Pontibacillus halophilus JSM 076056 = DSM 19796]
MKKKKNKTHIPFRINMLFLIVFILFSTLVLQLGVVQILNGEDLKEEINKKEHVTTRIPVPRGEIFDRHGSPIVQNNPKYVITYTPTQATSQTQKLEVAKKLAAHIEMPQDAIDDISVRDKKDYWYLSKELTEKDPYKGYLTKDEKAQEGAYQLLMDRVKEEDIKLTDQEKEEVAILHEFLKAYALSPHSVKDKSVTKEEYAKVAEHLYELPGVDVRTDYERSRPNGETFADTIGSFKEGIPKEEKDFFVSRNYSLDDRVGTSGIERKYEMDLAGQKEVVEHTTDKAGNLINSKVVHEGVPGNDLVLSIDLEYQKKVDEILQEEFLKAIQKDPYENRLMDKAMAVVLDPNTGEIYAMAGQHYDREDGEFDNVPNINLYNAYLPGSTVKGASVLTGLDTGVISKNTYLKDETIYIAGSQSKSSYKNLGTINELQALELSSNSYMWKIGMRIMGNPNYVPNQTISYERGSYQKGVNYFNQFGLGVKTGVDMYPEESVGVKADPKDTIAGQAMDHYIGQYTGYTSMQLAQYVATIGNGGYRIAPQIVKEIRAPESEQGKLGPVVRGMETTVLNRLSISQDHINHVKKGFSLVFNSSKGTASGYFNNKPYVAAGKTGTAQTKKWLDRGDETYYGVDKENLTLVGYASEKSLDQPDVAFAVVVPYVGIKADHSINKLIGERILDEFYKRGEEKPKEEEEEQEGSSDETAE